MILDDFKCEKCNHVWTESKNSIDDEYKVDTCPSCGYTKKDENDKTIFKKWGISAIDIAEGRFGNGKNGYNQNDVYMPSKYSTGTRFKNSAMYKEGALNLPDSYYSGH